MSQILSMFNELFIEVVGLSRLVMWSDKEILSTEKGKDCLKLEKVQKKPTSI